MAALIFGASLCAQMEQVLGIVVSTLCECYAVGLKRSLLFLGQVSFAPGALGQDQPA